MADICRQYNDRDLCTKVLSPSAALKTNSIDQLYSINSLFPCIFVLLESEIIFCVKASTYLNLIRAVAQR